MKSIYSAIFLIVPLVLCTGFVWRNPCRSDSVRLQKISRTGPTTILFEGRNVISAVDHAFVYNVGYKRITVLKTTSESSHFIDELTSGNCDARLIAVIVPDPGNPYREVFRIVHRR